jgi:hypothetical protein
MPKFKIDGFEIEVENGTTVLNAARMIVGDILRSFKKNNQFNFK